MSRIGVAQSSSRLWATCEKATALTVIVPRRVPRDDHSHRRWRGRRYSRTPLSLGHCRTDLLRTDLLGGCTEREFGVAESAGAMRVPAIVEEAYSRRPHACGGFAPLGTTSEIRGGPNLLGEHVPEGDRRRSARPVAVELSRSVSGHALAQRASGVPRPLPAEARVRPYDETRRGQAGHGGEGDSRRAAPSNSTTSPANVTA